MATKVENRTKRNLVIFTVLVLGLAALADVIEPLTVPPGAEPGTPGLGQLLWTIAPLGVMLLLRIFGGDGCSLSDTGYTGGGRILSNFGDDYQ